MAPSSVTHCTRNNRKELRKELRGLKILPVALAQRVQAQLVCDLRRIHGIWQVLLVGEHQQHCLTELVLQSRLDFGQSLVKQLYNEDVDNQRMQIPAVMTVCHEPSNA
jgi:hypothetical protein